MPIGTMQTKQNKTLELWKRLQGGTAVLLRHRVSSLCADPQKQGNRPLSDSSSYDLQVSGTLSEFTHARLLGLATG